MINLPWIPVETSVPADRKPVIAFGRWGLWGFPGKPAFLGETKYNPRTGKFDCEVGNRFTHILVTHWLEISAPDDNQDLVNLRLAVEQVGKAFNTPNFNEWLCSKFIPLEPSPSVLPQVYNEVIAERARQDEKWGGPDADDQRKTIEDWCNDIEAYTVWARQMARMGSPEKYRRRMMQVAALAVAACESFDRKDGAA